MLTERIQTVTRADGTNRATLNPPLKWAGGKRWQIPHLQSLWIAHRNRRLVEPFCGGLAVALGLGPERALLNDRNPNVIHFYRRVQEGLPITIPLENDSETYYAYRNRFNALLDAGHESSAEAASLFYYLNRLQRPVSIQSTRSVQRSLRSPHNDQLSPRLLGLSSRVFELVVHEYRRRASRGSGQ